LIYANNNEIALFEFNNLNGVISNYIKIPFNNNVGPYGIEFSPDGSKFYVSSNINAFGYLHQFDLILNSKEEIINSKSLIDSFNNFIGALQLGPDLKIYHSRLQATYLGVINKPNNRIAYINYKANGLYLKGNISFYGLPNFCSDAIKYLNFSASGFCLNDTTFFSLTSTYFDSVLWTLGDQDTTNNHSKTRNPHHVYSMPGSYKVTLKIYLNNTVSEITKTIHIHERPKVDIRDTLICYPHKITLNAHSKNSEYLWNTNDTSNSISISKSGVYWVQVSNHCATVCDTAHIEIIESASFEFDSIIYLCIGDSLKLNVITDHASYLWQDLSRNSELSITKGGIYWVNVSNPCGSLSDTVRVIEQNCHCYLQMPNAFTPNNDEINDVFTAISNCSFARYKLLIYNRWGQHIYTSNDARLSWNGKYLNKYCEIGVYYYQLKYQFHEMKDAKTIIGEIHLTR